MLVEDILNAPIRGAGKDLHGTILTGLILKIHDANVICQCVNRLL